MFDILAWLKSLFNWNATMPALPPGWNFCFSKNMPARMYQNSDGTYYFDFPQQDGVHYVLKQSSPLKLGQTVTMTFAIYGNGNLVAVDGGSPVHVRVMIQQIGDDLASPDKRWWSQPVELKTPGDYCLTAPLKFEDWIPIGGGLPSAGAAGFDNCVASIQNIGFSFGGWSAGHGAFSQGPSRFVLKSFTVS